MQNHFVAMGRCALPVSSAVSRRSLHMRSTISPSSAPFFSLCVLLGTLSACGSVQAPTSMPVASPSPNISGLEHRDSTGGTKRQAALAVDGFIASDDGAGPHDVAKSQEALVVEGFITALVDDVGETTQTIREQVQSIGGRIVEERGDGAATNWNGFLRLRIEPSGVDGLVEWLDKSSDIVSKRIQTQDVSKELFDHALALGNFERTMVRLQAILERPDLNIDAVLKIETELTRVRAQIESIKGSQRFLKDRVAYATLEIRLQRRGGVSHGPETKFMPGVRVSTMRLLDPGSRTSTRLGYGLVLALPDTNLSWELDIFAPVDGEKRTLVATFGGASYSEHLGGGLRTWLNPHLGMRVGYGRLDGSNFVLSGEAGVEIFKSSFGALDINVQTTGFFGKGGPEVALVSAAELSIAF